MELAGDQLPPSIEDGERVGQVTVVEPGPRLVMEAIDIVGQSVKPGDAIVVESI